MGMELMYRILTAEEAARLRKNPGSVEPLVIESIEALDTEAMRRLKARSRRGAKPPPDPGGGVIVGTETMLDLYKYWHLLHWLLCGDAKGGPEPLQSAVLGGQAIGDDLGYGPARLLDAKAVAAVAAALAKLDDAELRARFAPQAMAKAEICLAGVDDAGLVGLLLHAFHKTRELFANAAAGGRPVLVWLT